ncbi:hypothetical protein PGB90_006088 [Kerria lacca]
MFIFSVFLAYRECFVPEFRCINGQCIKPGYVCDEHEDCLDGSDELECEPEHFVECGDGSLRHKYVHCDNWPDCADNHADELNCGSCIGDDKFHCSNGRCIRKANVCDAHCDCLPAGNFEYYGVNGTCEDEQNCEEFYSEENGIKICNVGASISCLGNDRCIRGEFICDGVNDCHIKEGGGTDEYRCNATDTSDDAFSCYDGRVLPLSRVKCNYEFHCLNGEDEHGCETEYPSCKNNEKPLCSNGQCIEEMLICDGRFDCADKSDELHCHKSKCPPHSFRCLRSGHCIPEYERCDFFKDCPDFTDEIGCEIRECGEDEFQCHNGQCIDKNIRCVNDGRPKSGCSDRSHLLNCSNWKCSKGFYACAGGPCINETLLCNGEKDCELKWDDENNCTYKCAISDPPCECKDLQMNCESLLLTTFPKDVEKPIIRFLLGGNRLASVLNNETFVDLSRLIYLDLSNNNITDLTPFIFKPLWKLGVLMLQNNKIKIVKNNTFFGLSKLKNLHLEHNQIETLHSMAFYGLSSLTILDLSKQKISHIEKDAFLGLRMLTRLDLSWNKLLNLYDGTLLGMPKLLELNLSKNQLKRIEDNVFRATSTLHTLMTDEFCFCCLAKDVPNCFPPPDEFSSCEDLMSNIVLRICNWILGITATVGNLFVIVFRTLYKNTNNKVHSFLIKNLAFGDFLMGTYLLIIAIVDWKYRGTYSVHDSEWRSSSWCSLAGFLSTFSSELSVFTLTVITLDRFLVIIFPFRTHRLEMRRTRFLMMAGWVLAAIISIVPLPFLNITYFHNFYGRSAVCLPLHITSDKPNGWEYSVFVFLFLNFLSFTIIAASYLWMYYAARNTHRAVLRKHSSSESSMAFRMTLLVATDAACWIPIIILGVWSLAGFKVPPQVFAWVAVFVLPLNAALNPILYTLSTTPYMNPARQNLRTFRRSLSRERRSYNSTTIQYNQTTDCITTEDFYSLSSHTPSIRWLQKVDTVVVDHGETMPLRRVKSLRENISS